MYIKKKFLIILSIIILLFVLTLVQVQAFNEESGNIFNKCSQFI